MRELYKQTRVIGALMMRELITRYGREGLGFVWLILEPMAFCLGVMGMWAILKPEYEHGVRVAPFVMTGYMGLLLFRHTVSSFAGAIQANVGLIHHRRVKPLHIYLSRGLLEIAGGAVAYVIIYITLLIIGSVSPPSDYLTLFGGYLLMAWLAVGFGISLAALSLKFEIVERVVPVVMYLMIPLSGAFIMVDWIPYAYQKIYLLVPMPHTIEMMRSSVFGEFVATHYDPLYPLYFGAVMNVFGLTMLSYTQKFIEID